MTVLEQTKYRLIRAIIDDTDEKRIKELTKYYDDNPLLYSADELNKRIQQFEKEQAAGKVKYYTSEQLRKYAV